MDFDVLYNSLTDITDSTNSSVSRRPGKPRQQFSPAPEQQKKVQKKPTIDPPVRTKRLEFGDPNVQTQSQLARRLRRIPAQHFRLPKNLDDDEESCASPKPSSHLLDDFQIPLDADIDDCSIDGSLLYPDQREKYDDVDAEDLLIKTSSSNKDLFSNEIKVELDDIDEAASEFLNGTSYNSSSHAESQISNQTKPPPATPPPLGNGIASSKKKSAIKVSAENSVKPQSSKNKCRLNLNKLLKRTSLSSSKPNEKLSTSILNETAPLVVSTQLNASESFSEKETPSAAAGATSKRQPKPKFSLEYLYTMLDSDKQPSSNMPEKKPPKPLTKAFKPKVAAATSIKNKSILKGRMSMIKKPKSKNDLSKIPFEFDKSSGMLKSTAELLQSLKTNYQFDANFTDTSSFFNQLSQNAFEPQQYVDTSITTPFDTAKGSRRKIIIPRRIAPIEDEIKQHRKKRVRNDIPQSQQKKKPILRKFKPLTVSIDIDNVLSNVNTQTESFPTMTNSFFDAQIHTPKFDFNLKYPVYSLSSNQPQSSRIIENVLKRKALSYFARGLQHCEETSRRSDYFYREILSTRNELPNDKDIKIDDIDIDVVGEPSTGIDFDDERMVSNSSEICSQEISECLINQQSYRNEFGDDQDFMDKFTDKVTELSADVRFYVSNAMKFIYKQQLINMSSLELTGGVSMYYVLSLKTGYKYKASLKLYRRKPLDSLVAAHRWLLKNLPIPFLAAYLTLLKFVKTTGTTLCEYLIEYSDDCDFFDVNNCLKGFLQPKIIEPPLLSTTKLLDYETIPNVSLVLVYPTVYTKYHQRCSRSAHESLFRSLLPRIVCCVEKVELSLDTDPTASVEQCTWKSIQLIKTRVSEMVKRRPNDHVFVAGWGVSCLLNHAVISKISGVSGLIDFAFPTESPIGSRGFVEDEICLTYCPVLFIVGENASNFRMDSIKMLRSSMIADSGLIVISGANHNLFVSSLKLTIERVTQKCVERMIVKYVLQFMRQVVSDLGPPKDCRRSLKPVELPNIFDVDVTAVKGVTAERQKPRTSGPGSRNQHKTNNVSKVQPLLNGKPAVNKDLSMASQQQSTSSWDPRGMALAPTMALSTKVQPSRPMFSASIKNSVDSSTEVNIPSPTVLNQQILPHMSIIAPSASRSQENNTGLGWNEEEEAAAALEI